MSEAFASIMAGLNEAIDDARSGGTILRRHAVSIPDAAEITPDMQSAVTKNTVSFSGMQEQFISAAVR